MRESRKEREERVGKRQEQRYQIRKQIAREKVLKIVVMYIYRLFCTVMFIHS